MDYFPKTEVISDGAGQLGRQPASSQSDAALR